MATAITARIVVSKSQLQDLGLNPDSGDDTNLSVPIANWLTDRLPVGWDAGQLSVGIERGVKKDKTVS